MISLQFYIFLKLRPLHWIEIFCIPVNNIFIAIFNKDAPVSVQGTANLGHRCYLRGVFRIIENIP